MKRPAIAVVAPASGVNETDYAAGLAILQARFDLVYAYAAVPAPDTLLPYLCASDAERVAEFNAMLRDDRVSAIFCARGGYGSMRLLRALDTDTLFRRKPWIVGFSDITALHGWAAVNDVPSIHGPVVTQLAKLPAHEREALFSLIETGKPPQLSGLKALNGGVARGPLVGGNLTVLSHLVGTPFFPPIDGAVLLIEEVNESPYRIDRMLTQLALSGVLERLAGVVVGALIECDRPQGIPPQPTAARDVIAERLTPYNIPVVIDAPIGHGQNNMPLPLGWLVELDADNGTLRFTSGVGFTASCASLGG